MKSWLRTILYFLAVMIITAAVTAAVTVNVMNEKRDDVVIMSTKEFEEMSDVYVFSELIDKISGQSLVSAPDRATLIADAAKGMVAGLDDPYAAYFTAEEYESYLSNVNGQYDGVGLLVGQPTETGAPVLRVYEETPAAVAGMLTNDVIVSVDDTPVGGITLDELSSLIDKAVGTKVKLSVLRGAESMEFTLECATVNIKRVHHALFNERTGYIRLDMFTGNCVEEFKEALKDLTDRGMKSLVIDLRNNPGGALTAVVDIADMVLQKGTIVSVRGALDAKGEVYESNSSGISVPLAVIVNESSASASEIFAGAVQDNKAGMIVGMPTYGKGVVQSTMRLEANGGWLKLTTDAYYTPNGTNIDGEGITPDIEVDLPQELKGIAIASIDQSDDAQLWAALDYVREEAVNAD